MRAPVEAGEEVTAVSGRDWTVLRPGGFRSNALRWAESVRSSRTIAAPFADVALPITDQGDITAVAATVLRGTGHSGHTYELLGRSARPFGERAKRNIAAFA